MSLLALNGLRVSEAIGADIAAFGVERGHRTLTVVRQGGKLATMPLAPRVARAVDLAIVDRLDGPIFVEADGGSIVTRLAAVCCVPARVTCSGCEGRGPLDAQRFGPQVLVKVERPQRSEDERP